MKPIHPFPARMAPDLIDSLLAELPADAIVLDPMCGSGVVIKRAQQSRRVALGFDVDPLAVTMSSVWCSPHQRLLVAKQTDHIISKVLARRQEAPYLPWIDDCEETLSFIDYWFASRQQEALRLLSCAISYSDFSPNVRNFFWIALSRTIVTKHAGASLAWDVSHSRPHKVREKNDFDVLTMFKRSSEKLSALLSDGARPVGCRVRSGDCRQLPLKDATADAVVTSPPYLNAIDYLRGHKFSLVWMGYSIPRLRAIRSTSIGTEKSGDPSEHALRASVERVLPNIQELPNRQREIVHKYSRDSLAFLKEMRRVLNGPGSLSLVLGDCNVRGHFIENSKLFAHLAKQAGFRKTVQRRRELIASKRYLPSASTNNSLEKRMSYEIIQTYEAI